MNQMSWTDLKKAGVDKAKELLPLIVLVEGKPTFILSNDKDVILVSDLHIRVQNMLKALERKARMGMPSPIKVR